MVLLGTGSEWFWACLQFFAVLVSLVLIYIQIKIQTSQLKIQTLAHTEQFKIQNASHTVQSLSVIHSRWNSDSMLRARHHVCSRWVNGHYEFDATAQYVAEFLEELGTYVRIHAVSDREMWDVQSWYIEHYFCMFKDGMEQYQKSCKDKNLYAEFSTLYDCMNKINRELHSPDTHKSEEDIEEFLHYEISLSESLLKAKFANKSK